MKILFGMDVIRETGGYGGDILINGEKVTFNTPFDALAAGIGMVHQEFSLIPRLYRDREYPSQQRTQENKCAFSGVRRTSGHP